MGPGTQPQVCSVLCLLCHHTLVFSRYFLGSSLPKARGDFQIPTTAAQCRNKRFNTVSERFALLFSGHQGRRKHKCCDTSQFSQPYYSSQFHDSHLLPHQDIKAVSWNRQSLCGDRTQPRSGTRSKYSPRGWLHIYLLHGTAAVISLKTKQGLQWTAWLGRYSPR